MQATNLALVLSAVAGIVITGSQSSLKSRRPEIQDEPVKALSSSHVTARLWEDPLGVLERWELEREQAGSLTKPKSIPHILSAKSEKLVIPVIVDAGHYPERIENRIQQRFAVVAALNASNYERDNQEVLGIGELVINGVTNHVPYEWYSKNRLAVKPVEKPVLPQTKPAFDQPPNMTQGAFPNVCVLWLKSDFSGSRLSAITQPDQGLLTDYRTLAETLVPEPYSVLTNRFDIRVIGPRSSDDLVAVLQEMEVLRKSSGWHKEIVSYLQEREHSAKEAARVGVSAYCTRFGLTNTLSSIERHALHHEYDQAQEELLAEILQYAKPGRSHRILSILPGYTSSDNFDEKTARKTIGEYGRELRIAAHRDAMHEVVESVSKKLLESGAAKTGAEGELARMDASRVEGEARIPEETGNTNRWYWRSIIEQAERDIALYQEFMDQSEEELALDQAAGHHDAVNHELLEHAYNVPATAEDVKQQFTAFIQLCEMQIDRGGVYFGKKEKQNDLHTAVTNFMSCAVALGRSQADAELVNRLWSISTESQHSHLEAKKRIRREIVRLSARSEAVDQYAGHMDKPSVGQMGSVGNLYPSGAVCSIFSPWATADNYLLNTDLSDSDRINALLTNQVYEAELDSGHKDLEQLRQELLDLHGIHMNRTIHKDRRVIKALVRELEARQAVHQHATMDEEGKIILIGEWDSLFSRALSTSFALEYLKFKGRAGYTGWPQNIEVFEYLRGIDGLIPGASHVAQPEHAAEDLSGELNYQSLGERYPEGASQYDYLRRLAEQIRNAKSDGRKVKAVGIFGSDPYDKLLIIRALRKRIPDAVFFTTDLDARFFHDEELRWTRGLVVGSSYGLRLHEQLQLQTAPFRNVYQTAIYATMYTILNGEDWAFNIDDYEPRIFEISRDGYYDLSPSTKSRGDDFLVLHPDPGNRWEKHADAIKGSFALGLFLPVLLLGLFGYFKSRAENPGSWKPWVLWLLYAVILCGAGSLLLKTIADSSTPGRYAEALDFSSGISVWPAYMIRIMVLVLSSYFLLRTYFSIRSDNRCIPEEFGFRKLSREETGMGLFKNLMWPFVTWKGKSDISNIWAAYSCRRHAAWIYIVLFFGCFVYVYAGNAALAQDRPYVPWRGQAAFEAHRFTLIPALVSMVMLCGVTVYTLMRSTRLISSLYHLENGKQISCSWVNSSMPKEDAKAHLNNLCLVGRVTETTGHIIVYPFIVLFLMIMTRYGEIDVWDWPLLLVGIISLTLLIVLFAAAYLRYRAKEIQKAAVEALHFQYIARSGSEQGVEFQLREVRDYSRGAFSPLGSNPILFAVLTPVGGIGIMTVLQSLLGLF